MFAKWIGRTLHQLVPAHITKVHDLAPTAPIDLKHLGRAVNFKIKSIGRAVGPKRFIVCPCCNRGWMSRLEKRAQPVMEPLMLGAPVPEGTELDSSSLDTINTWVTKTAIVMDSADATPPEIPQSVRTTFYEDPKPLSGTRIWMAGYTPEYGHLTARHVLKVKRGNPIDGTPHDTVVLVTIVLGYLVLQFAMSGLPDGTLGQAQRRPMPNDFVIETWPMVSSNEWPPSSMLDKSTLDDFAVPNAIRPTQ